MDSDQSRVVQMSSALAITSRNNEEQFASLFDSLQRLARMHASPPVPIMRSNQVDAQRLDDELHSLLVEQTTAITAHAPEHLRHAWQPEISAGIALLILGVSLATSNTTPGASMLNLRYRNQRMAGNGGRTGVAGPGPSSLQRLGLVLGWVILPYAWQRGVGALVRLGWHRLDPTASLQGRIAWLIPRLEAIVRGASFLNAVVFLRWGEYRSLLERVLATRLVYDRPVMARAVSFDYLNRQLVWAQVSELFLFLLPLLDSRRGAGVLRGWVKGALAPLRALALTTAAAANNPPHQSGPNTTTIIHTCQVCTKPASTPYAAVPCGHVFCYYCLRARTEGDTQYCCPTCEQRVVGMAPAAVVVGESKAADKGA